MHPMLDAILEVLGDQALTTSQIADKLIRARTKVINIMQYHRKKFVVDKTVRPHRWAVKKVNTLHTGQGGGQNDTD